MSAIVVSRLRPGEGGALRLFASQEALLAFAIIGRPATASDPLMVARTPIREPTEISILPDTITIDMPIAATAI